MTKVIVREAMRVECIVCCSCLCWFTPRLMHRFATKAHVYLPTASRGRHDKRTVQTTQTIQTQQTKVKQQPPCRRNNPRTKQHTRVLSLPHTPTTATPLPVHRCTNAHSHPTMRSPALTPTPPPNHTTTHTPTTITATRSQPSANASCTMRGAALCVYGSCGHQLPRGRPLRPAPSIHQCRSTERRATHGSQLPTTTHTHTHTHTHTQHSNQPAQSHRPHRHRPFNSKTNRQSGLLR